MLTSVFAVWEGQRTANLIVKLDNGVLCSIEISLQLPPGSAFQERHEIIGRRGSASDRVVDTQVPQHSVYYFSAAGEEQYTDTDTELFGFSDEAIEHIRGALEIYKHPDLSAVWTRQHHHLVKIVRAAAASGEKHEKIMIS